MSLFSKLNQIKDLREQAKTLQNQLSQENVTVEKSGITLVMDGNQKIVKLDLNPEMLSADKKTKLEEIIKDLQNDAIQKVQRLMVEKMKSGNFQMPDLTKF